MNKSKADTIRDLARVVELDTIYFTRCDAERLVVDQPPRECSVEVAFGADAIVTSASTFQAAVTFQLTAKGADGAPVVRVKCQIAQKYRVPTGTTLDRGVVKVFSETNAIFHAWPYCREFIQSSIARLGMPGVFTLPPLKVSELLTSREPPAGDGNPKLAKTAH